MPLERNPKALRILKNTFWSSAGWRDPVQMPSPDDLHYATAAGYMFPSATLTHDEVVARVQTAAAETDPARVAHAFLASLTDAGGGRRVDWRSALGSYAVARHFPQHAFTPDPYSSACRVCGVSQVETVDYNVLNFERHQWGGVRHSDPIYLAFDLQQLARLTLPEPDEAGAEILRGILATVATLPPKASARILEKALSGQFPSSKYERDALLNILGLCGILASPAHPGFTWRFIPLALQDHPGQGDWSYPVAWWHAADGVNWQAVNQFFPGLDTAVPP